MEDHKVIRWAWSPSLIRKILLHNVKWGTRLLWCYSSSWWCTILFTQSYPLSLKSILLQDTTSQCWRGTRRLSLWPIFRKNPRRQSWRGSYKEVSVRLLKCTRCKEGNVEKVLEDMIHTLLVEEDAIVLTDVWGLTETWECELLRLWIHCNLKVNEGVKLLC